MNDRLEHDNIVKSGSIKIIFKLKKEEYNEQKPRKSTNLKYEETMDQTEEFQRKKQEKSYEIVNKRCGTQKLSCLCERKGYERVFSKEKIEERKKRRKYRRRLEKLSRALRRQTDEYKTKNTSLEEYTSRNKTEKREIDDLLEALIENTGVPIMESSGSTETEVINSFNESVHLLELEGRVVQSTLNRETKEQHEEEKNKEIFEHFVEIMEVPVEKMKKSTKPKDEESNKLLKLGENKIGTNGERKYNTFQFDDLLETLAESTGVPVIKPTDLSEAKMIGSINETVQLLKLRNILFL